MRSTILFVAVLATTGCSLSADQLFLAPTRAEGERLPRLLTPEHNSGSHLEAVTSLQGDNNVLALSKGDDRRLPTLRHGATQAYFAGFRQARLAFQHHAWSLSYSSGRADLYKGNRDAAQLYLDSKSGEFDPAAIGAPVATMNRSATVRWRLGYASPWRHRSQRGTLEVGLSYLRSQRVQFGTLSGETSGSAFTGDLVIQSTRPFDRPTNRGNGLAVDAAASFPLGPRAIGGLWVDNLMGFLDVGPIQVIRSTVRTNQVQTDPDGFLTNAPVLSGTVTNRSVRLSLRRRLDAAISYPTAGPAWALLYRNDYDARLGAAGIWKLPNGGRSWFAVWSRNGQWEAGADWRGLHLHVGFVGMHPEAAKQATVTLGFRAPIGL